MKVVHAITELGSGGAEAVVQELALGQAAAGHDVTVLSSGGRREPVLRTAGVRTVTAPLAVRSVTQTALGLRRAVEARRPAPDVLHGHNVRATAVAHLALRRLRRRPPLVATFHGVADADYPAAARWLNRCADQVVAVSEAAAGRLVDSGLARPPIVVRNAVTAPARHDKAEQRARLGLPQDVPVAVCVARAAPQKRHDVLLRAWDALPQEAVLLCAGAGPLLADLRAVAANSRWPVHVLGDRADVPQLLAAADLFVLASDWEGLPMAVLEAMATGLPVVATDVGGLREAVGADAGRLVPAGDVAALTVALADVLHDPAGLQRAGAAARRAIATRYSLDQMLSGYERLYGGCAP